jgi:hypothetical protein
MQSVLQLVQHFATVADAKGETLKITDKKINDEIIIPF